MSIFFRALLDLIFPPLCIHCKELTRLNYLCESCWRESALLDLHGRCVHCFEELDEGHLCVRCSRAPLLPFPRAGVFPKQAPIYQLLNQDHAEATAGFAYYQWLKMGWDEPDLIISIPPRKSNIGYALSLLFSKPNPPLFRRLSWPLGSEKWEVSEQLIEEHATILLVDEGCTLKQLQLASKALSLAFPKKVYLLSIFQEQ